MKLLFSCAACGAPHPSRLRIADPDLLGAVMQAFGEVLEPCPHTGRWMPVRLADLRWESSQGGGSFQTVAVGV